MVPTPHDEQTWRTLGPCDTLQEIKQEAEECQQKKKKDFSPSRWRHTEIFISAWNGVQSFCCWLPDPQDVEKHRHACHGNQTASLPYTQSTANFS